MLANLNFDVAPTPPIKFHSVKLTVSNEMSFEDFQAGHRGGLLGYRKLL